jgi:hypothetical protein
MSKITLTFEEILKELEDLKRFNFLEQGNHECVIHFSHIQRLIKKLNWKLRKSNEKN